MMGRGSVSAFTFVARRVVVVPVLGVMAVSNISVSIEMDGAGQRIGGVLDAHAMLEGVHCRVGRLHANQGNGNGA